MRGPNICAPGYRDSWRDYAQRISTDPFKPADILVRIKLTKRKEAPLPPKKNPEGEYENTLAEG